MPVENLNNFFYLEKNKLHVYISISDLSFCFFKFNVIYFHPKSERIDIRFQSRFGILFGAPLMGFSAIECSN